jgi:(1->4)-alpha-D-glucan 1-alpha-D-glucosylmutase
MAVPSSKPNGSSSPASTYRLQVRPSFDLHAAAVASDYLATLGAGALYLSPVLPSAPGSDHGYDVIAWDRIDPQRGGADGWTRMLAAARSRSLDIVVDIVPNHAATDRQDVAWASVLDEGQASPYAHWFDIEWSEGQLAHYRRFFAVDGLAGLRVEDESVFAATHGEILRWVAEDGIAGLRVDHPDGLADPSGYLRRLRAAVGPDTWLLVEKILEHGELLPPEWPVAGTTGYDALTEVQALFLDPEQTEPVTEVYRQLGRDTRSFAEHATDGKRQIANTILWPEVQRLARLVPDVRDAAQALLELLVCFPVYRSYLPTGADYLTEALDWVRYDRPDLASAIDALTPRLRDPADELCVRFQQTSGAVMAKGVEDTAYYRYSRFVALNEVGGNPARIGVTVGEWHILQAARQAGAGRSMTTLSTHDTKRGEDTRSRLGVVSELPREWAALVEELRRASAGYRGTLLDGRTEYLLWQTLVGTWTDDGPIAEDRLVAYLTKAVREAKSRTTWTAPDAAYERAVLDAARTARTDPAVLGLLGDWDQRTREAVRAATLGTKLVQLTLPGVADVYQGTEVPGPTLVDPDNRRPVDVDALVARLARLDDGAGPRSLADEKMLVTSRALRLRRDVPEAFVGPDAGFVPLPHSSGHTLTFARTVAGAPRVVVVATRLAAAVERLGGWADHTVALPEGTWHDVLSDRVLPGGVQPVADVLERLPVALLVHETT